jgi:hypothetical protein
MDESLTVAELTQRWEKVLTLTRRSVSNHPQEYRRLKSLAREIADEPLDIKDYLPTVKKLTNLLKLMDVNGQGTIFHLFNQRIRPSDIWQVNLLRVECRDLLAHLHEFDQWRLKVHRLKVVK